MASVGSEERQKAGRLLGHQDHVRILGQLIPRGGDCGGRNDHWVRLPGWRHLLERCAGGAQHGALEQLQKEEGVSEPAKAVEHRRVQLVVVGDVLELGLEEQVAAVCTVLVRGQLAQPVGQPFLHLGHEIMHLVDEQLLDVLREFP